MNFELVQIQEHPFEQNWEGNRLSVKLLPTTKLSEYYIYALRTECASLLAVHLTLKGKFPERCVLELMGRARAVTKPFNFDYWWQPLFHIIEQDSISSRLGFLRYHTVEPYIRWHFLMTVRY